MSGKCQKRPIKQTPVSDPPKTPIKKPSVWNVSKETRERDPCKCPIKMTHSKDLMCEICQARPIRETRTRDLVAAWHREWDMYVCMWDIECGTYIALYRVWDLFFWWVLQHCTGFARLVWGRLRVRLAFIYSNWFVCSVCFCSLLPRLTFLLSFLDILHCLPRAVGVPLESALNLVSPMSPCGAHDTHACCARSNDHLLYLLW